MYNANLLKQLNWTCFGGKYCRQSKNIWGQCMQSVRTFGRLFGTALFCVESCMHQHRKLAFTMTAKSVSHLQCSLLLVFVLVFTVTILTGSNLLKRTSFVPNFVEFQPDGLNKAAQCYRWPKTNHSIRYFDDVLDAKIQPKIGQTIFFHETTCSKTGIVHLNAK